MVFLPIYSSARERRKDFPADLLGRLQSGIARSQKKIPVRAVSFSEAIAYGKSLFSSPKQRVIITLGAGDGWKIAKGLTEVR